MTDCPFCDIIVGDAPATAIVEYDGVTLFQPLNPVTPGHMLAVPNVHIAHAADDPQIAGRVFEMAAEYARDHFASFNLITSANEAATQTVYHLHVHIVPRREGDGLALPWTSQNYEETWVNAMSAVSPSDEFLRDIGRSVISHLRQQPDYPREVIIKFRSS